MTTESVVFRLIIMPCCSQLLCWINPRLPNYCPECGKPVMHNIAASVVERDDNAILQMEINR